MRRFAVALFAVAALFAGACSSSDDSSDDASSADDGATPDATVDEAPAETAPPTTDTLPPEATALPDLQIVFVEFGNEGYVEIANVGDEPADVSGIQFCQFPTYVDLGTLVSAPIAPGESVQIAGSDVGGLGIAGGEAALYSEANFTDPNAIIAYVQWGTGGGRADVAAEAGIWPAGASVTPSEEFNSIELFGDPADPESWS